jgi:hypothetical protein
MNRTSLKAAATAWLDFSLRLLCFVAVIGILVAGVVQPKDWTAWLYSDRASIDTRVEDLRRKTDELQHEVDAKAKLEGELSEDKASAAELESDINLKDVQIRQNTDRNTSAEERNKHDAVLQIQKKQLVDSLTKVQLAIVDLSTKIESDGSSEIDLNSDKRERDAAASQLSKLDANLDGASYYTRLFSLGGLGALVTLLNAYRKGSTSLIKATDLSRNTAGMIVGGIVAVAATNLVMAGAINPFKITIADLPASGKTLLLVGVSLCAGAASEVLIRALVHWLKIHYPKRTS